MGVDYSKWRETANGAAPLDCAAAGFKCGIEIHQQVDSRKLFCGCESTLRSDAPSGTVARRLRAVAGELGEVDAAALQAAAAGKTFYYEYYDDATCLVELDEEPPHELNSDALKTAMQVALLLGATPVGEIQVMRKTVVDGSNTSGFQRTALVATKGRVQTTEGESVIEIVSLEEDAARIITQTPSSVTFRLDRLGIPLIEIVTDPSLRSPRQAMETARLLGDVLRSTKVKRGLGTIRQDVSVSVSGGTRIEVKGVQTLELIPLIAENEARRQIALVGIAAEIKKIVPVPLPASEVEKNAVYSHAPNGAVEAKLKLPGGTAFAALLREKISPARTLEQEFIGRSKAKSPQANARFDYSTANGEAVFVASGQKNSVEASVRAVTERYAELFEGVPRETRRALEDGSTEYMRPLAGAARMYPETDVPHLKLASEYVEKVKASLPELRSSRIERMKQQYALERGEATEIMDAGYAQAFEESVKLGLAARLVSNEILAFLRSTGEEKLSEEALLECLRALKNGRVPRESLQACLTEAAKNGADAAIQKISASGAKTGEVDEIIRKVVAANPGKGFQALMGDVMKEMRGKASGSEIAEKLRKALNH